MTEANGPRPHHDEDLPAEPNDPAGGDAPASSPDPTAKRPAGGGSGEAARADPEGLDQSVGRDDAGDGDARTRDGAI